MHVTLHINLTHIDSLIKEYTAQAVALQTSSYQIFLEVRSHWKIVTPDGQKRALTTLELEKLQENKLKAHNIIKSYIGAAGEVAEDLRNLQGILPVHSRSSP